MAYDFHYTPTGTGVISGKEVLEQTEDAINDLGNTAISGVQEALDKAEQALTNSENAVDDAQTALNTANNAEGVAIQAQTDVGNLSGTVTNIGNRVTTAEGNISNLQGRMTTAEGKITNLQGRMTTAESDIGNLQTAVSTAQATANSAQQTATTARQQSYVFRYSSTALTPSSTNSNSLLDNTDNLKVGDKVIDSSGVLFSITAIDTQNSTFTIGTALIDLALDANVVHTSGNENVGGIKNFTDDTYIKSLNFTNEVPSPSSSSSSILPIITTITYGDSSPSQSARLNFRITADGIKSLYPHENNQYALGLQSRKWSEVRAIQYYYGSSDVEFSNKFVTTDTAQSVSGQKVFSDINAISSSAEIGVSGGNNSFKVLDKNKKTLSRLEGGTYSSGMAYSYWLVNNGSDAFNGVTLYQSSASSAQLRPYASILSLQLGSLSKSFSDCYTSKINGLTPSSLSLPSTTGVVDISSYITDLTGTANTYTALVNGYIQFDVTGSSVEIDVTNGLCQKWIMTDPKGFIPVVSGASVSIKVVGTAINNFKFIPCRGNV